MLAPHSQFAELIPEKHAEDGVGAQAQVGGAQTLVESQGALQTPGLHQAVSKAPVQPALGTDTVGIITGAMGLGLAQQGLSVCGAF